MGRLDQNMDVCTRLSVHTSIFRSPVERSKGKEEWLNEHPVPRLPPILGSRDSHSSFPFEHSAEGKLLEFGMLKQHAIVWVGLLLAPLVQASIFDGELSSPHSMHALLTHEKNIVVELGVEYLHPALPTIRDIVVENPSTSTAVASPRTGDVNSDYPDTFAQTLKVQALLNPVNDWTFALKTYLPLNGLTQMDTGNVYQPEFVLYRAESQRPRVLLSSGLNLDPEWRVGLGLDLGFSVTARANVFLQSGAGTVSDQRISAKVKPSLVPQASVAYRSYSFTVRGENKANFDLSTIAGARVFSNLSAGVDFSYSSQSALFYQPWQLELRGENRLNESFLVKYGISYELWSGYQARAAVVHSDTQFSSGLLPAFQARNLWVPEAGLVFGLGMDALEADYQYKNSIFMDVPRGNGNYLDPPRHDLKLAWIHPTQSGIEWNFHTSLSRLTEQTVVKSDPNDIGGPGYQASGWVYGGGVSVAVPFKN
ncbi:MAG: hypothetical protein H7333_08895 [Bdellovibrionales bacterium]|nr:hypothetical protein [Oligoflexia bacterium]